MHACTRAPVAVMCRGGPLQLSCDQLSAQLLANMSTVDLSTDAGNI